MSCVIPFPAAEAVPGDGLLPRYPVAVHDAVAGWRRRHRHLVTAAGRWALARGLALPADHVALWAAAAEQSGRYGDVDGVTGPWLRPELHRFCWSTLSTWCTEAGCPRPADLPRSLWHLYGFLAESGRLHPASDPIGALRQVLVCAGGFGCYGDHTGPQGASASPEHRPAA